MFIPLIAAISVAASFALLGALMVKVSMLTLALQALTVVALIAALVAGLAVARSRFSQPRWIRTH